MVKNIYSSILDKLKSRFVRNIIVLCLGTGLAQVAALIFIPFITRIYGPEAFGAFGFYSSLLSFMAPLSSLALPLAIVLPKANIEARIIFNFSLKICFLSCLIISTVMLLIELFYPTVIPFSAAFILVPVGVFLSVYLLLYTQWCIREGFFRLISSLTLLTAFLGGGIKTVAGLVLPSGEVLVLSTLLVLAVQVAVLGRVVKLHRFNKGKSGGGRKYRFILKKYYRFPAYRLPHSLLAVISQVAPVFLLTIFFDAESAGYFVLTRTVLSAPVTLIGKAVYDVTYPKINKRYYEGLKNYSFILSLTLVLTIISILPLIGVYYAGETVFSMLFGAEWVTSGSYAKWMSIWFAFNFLNKASAAAISTYSMDKFLFVNGVMNNILSLSGFLVGLLFFESDLASVALFSLCGVICQVTLICKVLRVIRNNESKLKP